jgi:hypothetical protein
MAFQVVKAVARTGPGWLATVFSGLALVGAAAVVQAADGTDGGPVFGASALVAGADLHCLLGVPSERVGLVACRNECEPIPWQLDERGSDGQLALESGPLPNPDDSPGVIDENDEIRWMVEDAGRSMRPQEHPDGVRCGVEIRLAERETHYRGYLYAFVWPDRAPRSARSYVHYDPERDVITGRRVALGFGGATPQYLALVSAGGEEQANLLDRLKVRASAWFLGVIPVSRDESDLTTEFVAWHGGPIRVIRRQRQWVRVGFGIRSPTFGSYTYFYRDSAELPVSLGLNFPPTYFFHRICIRAVLDFRDLRGWNVLGEGMTDPLPIGSMSEQDIERLNGLSGDWFALIGPEVTLVQFLGTSSSLATLKSRLLYTEHGEPQEPEDVPGEMPAIGYLLSDWEDVPAGKHWFSSTSFALPPGEDPRDFVRSRKRKVTVQSREWPVVGQRDEVK